MSPPPRTPTPRRFLLAKRGGGGIQSSQTPTGPPRFQSTPRFGSSSVPRPTQGRTVVDIEDVEEVGESSSSGVEDETRKHVPLNDSIEVDDDDDDDVTASRDGSVGFSISEDDQEPIYQESTEPGSPGPLSLPHDTSPLEEREPKRRRVSISPMPESSHLHKHHYLDNSQEAEESREQQTPTQSSAESLQDAVPRAPPQQPTFRPPPRFKPAEVDPTVEGLPAAFSPQRRGAKYVAGGLAAGLQGWLSEVKGWEGTVPSAAAAAAAASVVEVVVQEVRPGRRMYLVKGRTGDDDAPRRFLLAGEGRLTGLGQRVAITVGKVVEVGQPVWDVQLDGQVWTVACDWGVS